MAITRKPAKIDGGAAAFIGKAPDAQATLSNARGKQSQITLTIPPGLLARVDAEAQRLSISRAGYIKMSLTKSLEN